VKSPHGPFRLAPDDWRFPPPELALEHPNGLLAVGGDLSPRRLLTAYRNGIFPWYTADEPILWWSPDPRAVLFPQELKISRSLRKVLRRGAYEVTLDRAFEQVISGCAGARRNQQGSWIVPEMQQAYMELHRLGFAHSVECWTEGELVGGLYGVTLGKVFFGESMFSHRTDASKAAFAHFVRQLIAWDYQLIDSQVGNEHMFSLGVTEIPRDDYLALLDRWCDEAGQPRGQWQFELDTRGWPA
jgi:leucyl/phenylalanyl-tRNA--protein transferase